MNNEDDIKKLKASLYNWETTLFQKSQMNNATIHPYYLENMLQAQSLLKHLDMLENKKYTRNYTNARQLLSKYLSSHYDFPLCQTLNLLKKCKLVTSIHDEHPTDDHISSVSPFTLKDTFHISPTINKHFNTFFETLLRCKKLNSLIQLNLSKSTKEKKEKTYYHIPFCNIFPFLLLFTYYDGRNFDKSFNPRKISHFKKENQYTFFSYKLIIKKMKDINSKFLSFQERLTRSKEPNEPDFSKYLYLFKTIYACDNIFLFQKLNRLIFYYEIYLRDELLNSIISSYHLKYQETIKLSETIQKEIFGDTDFMISGLTSEYLDFMLLFDIYFQKNILASIRIHPDQYGLEGLIRDINDAKTNTKQFFKININEFENIPSSLQSDDLSIIQMEKDIFGLLNKNNFCKEYYLSSNNFYNIYENQQKDNPIFPDFQLIKTALNLITNPSSC